MIYVIATLGAVVLNAYGPYDIHEGVRGPG